MYRKNYLLLRNLKKKFYLVTQSLFKDLDYLNYRTLHLKTSHQFTGVIFLERRRIQSSVKSNEN
jgi:hypothetical protein